MNLTAFVPPVFAFVLVGLAVTSQAPGQDRPRTAAVATPLMTLVKVGQDSITARTMPTNREGSREVTFATDPKGTKVVVGVLTGEETAADGRVRRRYKTEPGTLADLEAGQLVRVTIGDGVATEIVVTPAPSAPPARRDEGAREKGGARGKGK